jgi:hypothetical protein
MEAKLQHYVPRFLLTNFSTGKRSHIWAYDKHRSVRFRANVKNLAAEKGFYDHENGEGRISFESVLSSLESKAAKIIARLVRAKHLGELKADDRSLLSAFFAVQFVRTKEYRNRYDALIESLVQRLRESGMSEEEIRRDCEGPGELKLSQLKSIVNAEKFVPFFFGKTWVLHETKRSAPFYISDNPITLHNQKQFGPYGNLGLAVPGIEIYIPLCPTLGLGMICPTYGEECRKGYDNFRMMDQMQPGLADALLKDAKGARAFSEAVVNGTPSRLMPENLMMLNSLQVIYSSRFVFSETDDFSLVEKMIKDNEKYRRGLGIEVL